MTPHPLSSTLFPYTTLFRSLHRPRLLLAHAARDVECVGDAREQGALVEAADVAHGVGFEADAAREVARALDRKSTRLNSSHVRISYAVFCLKKKTIPFR